MDLQHGSGKSLNTTAKVGKSSNEVGGTKMRLLVFTTDIRALLAATINGGKNGIAKAVERELH